jgi:polyisoprenoid-binding protein YceI
MAEVLSNESEDAVKRKKIDRGVALVLACLSVPAFAGVDHYDIEPMHTYPSIEFSHMGISVWRGKFDRTTGSITLDREARSGTVDISVDTASVNFGLDEMDKAARSEDWFDVEKYPTATYTGTIRFDGDTPSAVDGRLTFRGVTQALKLSLNSFKCIEHPFYKKQVCGADAQGELNWAAFGMKHSEYGQGDAGRLVLRIQVEALKQAQ